jgi:hypothetical protein
MLVVIAAKAEQSIYSAHVAPTVQNPVATFYNNINTNQNNPIPSLVGSNVAHLKVINNTQQPISIITSNTVPGEFTGRDLYVVSLGYATWDNLPIFNSLYIQVVQNGSSVWTGSFGGTLASGDIFIEAFGGAGLRP